jgi:hypothetical protein
MSLVSMLAALPVQRLKTQAAPVHKVHIVADDSIDTGAASSIANHLRNEQ